MHTPFKHPLATHCALDVLGWRRNGAPIYAIAGGSGEGEGAGATPPAGDGNQPPPAGEQPKSTPPATTPDTDWKAEARKWEKRAKENNNAATELEQLRAAQMTEQERAVAEAETRGRTAAASEYGRQLAAARFEAAAATAGVQLGDAAELIDTARFVAADGSVDTDAIQTAVTRLAAIAPKPGPGRSGADLSGGHGDTPPSLEKQIAEAQANGDYKAVMRLQNSKLPGLAAGIQ
jgi:hypothetical protein